MARCFAAEPVMPGVQDIWNGKQWVEYTGDGAKPSAFGSRLGTPQMVRSRLVRLAEVAASLVLLAVCAGVQAAGRCQSDLNVSWAPSSCMNAIQDPSNRSVVSALGDEACARARLGTSDSAVGDAQCEVARAKAEKAAWLAIERAASAGTQPELVLDHLVPDLPKTPAPIASTANAKVAPANSTLPAPASPPASATTEIIPQTDGAQPKPSPASRATPVLLATPARGVAANVRVIGRHWTPRQSTAPFNDGQPQGLKFKDGWTLKWGDSMEILASHFAKVTVVRLSDRRSRVYAKDSYGADEDHAFFETTTGGWQYYSLSEQPIPEPGANLPLKGSLDDKGGVCWPGPDEISDPYNEASVAFDEDNRFYGVELRFTPDAYDLIVKMLEPELGEPVSRDRSTLQNGFGALFEQKTVYWKVDAVTVHLRRLGDNAEVKTDFGSLEMKYEPFAPVTPELKLQNPF
jgi:hypothetical protein